MCMSRNLGLSGHNMLGDNSDKFSRSGVFLFRFILPCCSQESPKRRTCQSVSNITEKEERATPKLVKYYSSSVFDDSSPGSRYRFVSSSKKLKQSVLPRAAYCSLSNRVEMNKKRPNSIFADTTAHSRLVGETWEVTNWCT